MKCSLHESGERKMHKDLEHVFGAGIRWITDWRMEQRGSEGDLMVEWC